MCKFNPKNDSRRIDPCMKTFIVLLNHYFIQSEIKVVACCCGHNKYPMTILVKGKPYHPSGFKNPFVKEKDLVQELVSGKIIPRQKKFYKKDKQGYYYIPEVINVHPKR